MTKEWAKALVATIVLVLLVVTGTSIPGWRAAVVPTETMEDLTNALFTTYVVPFEVLSVLLLGALLGALYVGGKIRKEGT